MEALRVEPFGLAAIALALALLGAGALAGQPRSQTSDAGAGTAGPVVVSSIWDDLELVDLEGRRFSAPELEGRVVLLDFWATWCAPCLEELPTLVRAWQRYRERDFLLFGVSVDRLERGRLASWLRRHQVTWPQIHDTRGFSGELPRRFGVEYVPRSIVLDRQGRIVAVDLRGEVLLTVLRDLLE